MAAGGGNFILDKGYDAGGVIRKYRAVKFSADETVVELTASTDVCIGIEQFGVTVTEQAKGKGASVRTAGRSVMEAGAAIATVGTPVMADTQGRAVVATSTNRVIGVTEDTAGVAGDQISVMLDLPSAIL
jgi:hypothetical protein